MGRFSSYAIIATLFFAVLLLLGCASRQAPPPISPPASSSNQSGMKVIGLIGGVSWTSSEVYYKLMNEMANQELGGEHSAKILMYSVEFGDIADQEKLALQGNWTPLRMSMVDAAKRLESGGADFIIIASNTLHSTVDDIKGNVSIPVLHIADATGAKVSGQGIKKVALLGTKYTMEAGFYKSILEKKYGLEVVTPNADERDYINNVIFDELCVDVIRNESRQGFIRIIQRLVDEEGVQGVIFGCTEIQLLISQEDVPVPAFDTTRIHARAAVDYALGKGNMALVQPGQAK